MQTLPATQDHCICMWSQVGSDINTHFTGCLSKLTHNRPFHTEIGKFRNIQCVNHGKKAYYLYTSALLGASTTMTRPRVWHSITHSTRNCWCVEVILLLTMLKQLPHFCEVMLAKFVFYWKTSIWKCLFRRVCTHAGTSCIPAQMHNDCEIPLMSLPTSNCWDRMIYCYILVSFLTLTNVNHRLFSAYEYFTCASFFRSRSKLCVVPNLYPICSQSSSFLLAFQMWQFWWGMLVCAKFNQNRPRNTQNYISK